MSAQEPSLQVERFSFPDWAARCAGAAPPLGGLAWGWGAAQPDGSPAFSGLAMLDTPLLGATQPWVDAWLGNGGPLRQGRSGSVQWHTDGQWVFGQLHLPEVEGSLEATAYRAYRDLFAALQDSACQHPLRLWNYLPRINTEVRGLERYRQFNIGRQRAFIDAGHDAFEGAPAACALGTVGDGPSGLSVRFLAGQKAPLPVDNPRQVPAYRYSTSYGPRAPTFSRAALVDAGAGRVALMVSGTASIVGEHTVHQGDVVAQTLETLRNLEALIESAHRSCRAHFTLADLQPTVYVRHAVDTATVLSVLAQAVPAWGAAPCVQADICRADLLVEVEAHAMVPGALA
jgi:chorismate lyase/3-hydroxybenzoate synthase